MLGTTSQRQPPLQWRHASRRRGRCSGHGEHSRVRGRMLNPSARGRTRVWAQGRHPSHDGAAAPPASALPCMHAEARKARHWSARSGRLGWRAPHWTRPARTAGPRTSRPPRCGRGPTRRRPPCTRLRTAARTAPRGAPRPGTRGSAPRPPPQAAARPAAAHGCHQVTTPHRSCGQSGGSASMHSGASTAVWSPPPTAATPATYSEAQTSRGGAKCGKYTQGMPPGKQAR